LCLSYGFHVSKDAKKIIKAFIVGWEIAARVGIASKGTFHKRGGQVFALFVMGVAACEVAVGVAFCVLWYRRKGTLELKSLKEEV
ncbi:NADH-quinone oxidoreductase subunit K, partial [Campylobacter coli]